MSLKRNIVKSISFVALGEAVSNILSYFLIILIARSLGTEGLGIYSFAFAFVGLFVIFYDFGISTFYVKKISESRENSARYFGNYAALKLAFCIIAMLLPMASIIFLKRSIDVIIIVYLASISLFFQNYSYVARNAFQAYQAMHYDAIVRIIERTVAFGLGYFVLSAGYGLMAFLYVLVFSNLLSLAASIMLLKKIKLSFSLKADFSLWKNMLINSWPFWLTLIFMQLYFQIDTVMISFMKGYEATGLYNAAYKLISVMSRIPWVIIIVLFPVMSELYSKLSKELLRQVLEKGIHVMSLLSLPIIFGTAMLSDRIIAFIYKEGFSGSSLALQVLVWSTFFLFLSTFIGWFLNAIDRQKVFTYSTGASLLSNVAMNIILIPNYSYIGASIATLVTSIINFSLLYYFNSRYGYHVNIARIVAKPLISSVLMAGFIFFFGDQIHLIALIPISAIIYFLALVAMGDIKKDDFKGIF